MKTALKCDEVFDLLTAGPLDEAESNQAAGVDEHLLECDSCRNLAEAMRPALHILHESLPPEQLEGLPVYLSADDLAVREIMRQVRSAPTVRPERGRLTTTLLWLVASAACLLIGTWIYNSSVSVSSANEPSSLASMSLPPACTEPLDAELDHEQTEIANKYECCTRCHNSSTKTLEDHTKLSSILLACQHCHTGL